MTVVAPCVLAHSQADFDAQIQRVQSFAKRIHFDFVDGDLAPGTGVPLARLKLPKHCQADLHLMYRYPTRHMRAIVALRPHLVIVHAEASGDFITFARILRKLGIKVGVALLPETPAAIIAEALRYIDHVMIFSGTLGHFGGRADLDLLVKAQALKHLKPSLEIGWDGGVNDHNAHLLAAGGVDVLNVGGFIQKASKPANAYAILKRKLGK